MSLVSNIKLQLHLFYLALRFANHLGGSIMSACLTPGAPLSEVLSTNRDLYFGGT